MAQGQNQLLSGPAWGQGKEEVPLNVRGMYVFRGRLVPQIRSLGAL